MRVTVKNSMHTSKIVEDLRHAGRLDRVHVYAGAARTDQGLVIVCRIRPPQRTTPPLPPPASTPRKPPATSKPRRYPRERVLTKPNTTLPGQPPTPQPTDRKDRPGEAPLPRSPRDHSNTRQPRPEPPKSLLLRYPALLPGLPRSGCWPGSATTDHSRRKRHYRSDRQKTPLLRLRWPRRQSDPLRCRRRQPPRRP